MQVKSIIFTVLIAVGFALLANSWEIGAPGGQLLPVEQSRIATLPVPALATARQDLNQDSMRVRIESAQLSIRYDSSGVARRIQDLVVMARIEKQLFNIEQLKRTNISVVSLNGYVVIDGLVQSPEVKRLIESTVEKVPGVKTIESKIQLAKNQ